MRAFVAGALFAVVGVSASWASADDGTAPTTSPAPTATPDTTGTPTPTATPAATSTPSATPTSTYGPIIQIPEKLPRAWRYAGVLGVVSLPRLLSLELLAKYERPKNRHEDLVAFGPRIEYLPSGIASFGTTNLSWFQVGVEGRFYPWRFLYAGAGAGWQFSRADSVNFGSKVEYITRSFFVTPQIGALYTFPSGLAIGGDLGATIPFGANTSLYSDGTTDSNARKVAKTFGMFVMPYASLFRIGYTL